MTLAFNHTPHIKKQTIEFVVKSLATSTLTKTNYRSIGPHNGSIFHAHTIQGPYIVLSKTPPTFVHYSTPLGGNYLPI
jgi:hypothetical protein